MIPWQAKIAGKLILSRFPMTHQIKHRIGIFKHGKMDDPSYAFDVFKNHYDLTDFNRKNNGFVMLELGPGDSLFSAMIANAYNAGFSYLVDAGHFAVDDMTRYQLMSDYLRSKGLHPPNIDGAKSLGDLLEACEAQYEINGLESLKGIPDGSVDFVWSQAVLEHIRKADFPTVLFELRRILHRNGVCSHRVDLRDHLGGALNNLRFSKDVWESNFMASSGFYTNRIRYSRMLELFAQAGFNATVIKVDRWPEMPTPRKNFSAEFAQLDVDELRISGFDVLLRPI